MCSFSCKQGFSDVNVKSVDCKFKKNKYFWDLSRKIKQVKCAKEDDDGDDGVSCQTFSEYDDNVVANCDAKNNLCSFSCKQGFSNLNIESVACKIKKNKAIWDNKGKTVTCEAEDDGDNEVACKEFTEYDDSVNADCNAQSCSFSCANGFSNINLDNVKCVEKKKNKYYWKLPKGIKQIKCEADDDNDGDKDKNKGKGKDKNKNKKNDEEACDKTKLESDTNGVILKCDKDKTGSEYFCTVKCTKKRTPSRDEVKCNTSAGSWNVGNNSINCN